MKFVNRTDERNFMKKIILEVMNKQETCVWIEGSRGVGKSYFLKYMKEDSDMPIFSFADHNWIFKCNEATIDNEYQFFIEIISSFQLNYPKEFNHFLVKYFENICDISWVETLAYVIPNIKLTEWAKGLINRPLEQIETAKKEVTDMLYNPGLRKCLAMIVLHFLIEVEKRDNIVFCIDDACWLDKNSIDTLQLLLNIAKFEKSDEIKISLVILTRPKNELEPEKQNYDVLETVLKEIYEELRYIKIRNFSYEATQEYIKLMDKDYVREITNNIYKVTNGNPQQLYQALKFDDYDLKEIVNVEDKTTCSNYISAELIFKLGADNTYILPIICSVSLLQQKMQLAWLLTILKSFCNQVLYEEFNVIKYDESIQLLQAQNIIKGDMNTIEIVHDSWKETAVEYIKNCGEYTRYMKCITDSIRRELPFTNTFIRELMHLYSEFDSIQCFDMFVNNYKENTYFLDGNIIKFVIQSLCKEISLFTLENIEKYIVPIVLTRCIQLSYYEFGYKICSIISIYEDNLSNEILYKYLVCFAKILIDKGKLQKTEKYNAIDIIERITHLPQLEPNKKIESYLLAMSAYEHVLDFSNINKYNSLAENTIKDNEISDLYHAMYLRNQGLVKSHRDLNKEYFRAIDYSNQVENTYEKYIMLGTCYNNLGLHCLYSSEIKKALEYFKNAKKYLDEIGYDTFRVLNNIGICYMLSGENELAYNFLLQAKALNIDCIFEKLCIQNNLAILEHKQGKHKIAHAMIKPILDEYIMSDKQTGDDLIYSSAMVNWAYFYYVEKNYWESIKWYKKSQFFEYRYNDDLQKKKREEMIRLCMYHCEIGEKPTHSIDLDDNTTDLFKKMYAPIPFAYYII